MKMTVKTRTAAAVSLIILLLAGIGTTVAYIVTHTNSIVNKFTPTSAEIIIDEEIVKQGDKYIKKNVTVKNTGSVDVYVRADVIVTWKDSAGNIYSAAPLKDTDYKISFGSDWKQGTDGYFYYNSVLKENSVSTALISGCEKFQVPANIPDGYDLSVEILMSAVQSVPASAVIDAWGFDPAEI